MTNSQSKLFGRCVSAFFGQNISKIIFKIIFFELILEYNRSLVFLVEKKSTTLTKILNKAYLYSHKHQVLQVHSHKHKHIQSFVVFFFCLLFVLRDTVDISSQTHRIQNVEFRTLTCADRCVFFVSLRKEGSDP